MSNLKKQIKRFCGRRLVEFASAFPTTKRLFEPIGMRTFEGFFGGSSPIKAQTPSGESVALCPENTNYLTLQLFWKGTVYYEPLTTFLILELLRTRGTFIDVGANIGFFSLIVAQNRPDTKIFAFEPNPKNFRTLKMNVSANGFQTIQMEAMAISATTGIANLFLHPSDMSASLSSEFQPQTLSHSRTIEVPLTTLDSYFNVLCPPVPVVLKVDVEGHEASVLRGARSFLEQFGPDLIVEVLHSYPDDVTELLRESGYSIYQITDRGLTRVNGFELVRRGELVFLNYLLSKREEESLDAISKKIAAYAKGIDLKRTSKYFGPAPNAKTASSRDSNLRPSETVR